jgi:hypothetical protein
MFHVICVMAVEDVPWMPDAQSDLSCLSVFFV